MRLVNIAYLQEGDILARPVRNHLGTVMLGCGIKLTSSYIRRLKGLGYDMVFIEDDRLDDVDFSSPIAEETRETALKTLEKISELFANDKDFDDMEGIKSAVKNMINDLLNSRDIIGNLTEIQGYDDYTYQHSINTTIVALIIGIAYGYSDNKLLELGMGVMMHDVGKVLIPKAILNKETKLTEEEFHIIRQHPVYGFEFLRKNKDFSLLSAHVALQHQEKWDGTGYPRGLKGKEIHEYGRIAAIADVYEALTSKRIYRNAIPPNEAYEYIVANSYTQFDPQAVKNFAQRIAVYPTGAGVVLSNGQRGNIVKQNNIFPNRPYVRVFYQEDAPLLDPVDYNLAEHPSLMILKIENR